jgi:hypothetical protein
MTSRITWEEETRARLEQARKEQKEEQIIAERHFNNAKRCEEIVDALEKILRLMPSQGRSVVSGTDLMNSEQLSQSSTWENLNTIMDAKNGLLVVNEAVDFLVRMKVFANRKHARNVIYSTLYSHKKDVIKVREGIYQRRESTIGKEAHGESLHSNEVWKRMQQLGIMSNARDPAAWIDRVAVQNGAVKVAPRTWLIKDNAQTAPIQTTSEQTIAITGIPSVQGIVTTQ